MVIFLGGTLSQFSWTQFQDQLGSIYRPVKSQEMSFWAALAIYFPAVTSIMTGVDV